MRPISNLSDTKIKKILSHSYSDIVDEFTLDDVILGDERTPRNVAVVYVELTEDNYNNMFIAHDKTDDTTFIYEMNKCFNDLSDNELSFIKKHSAVHDDDTEDATISDWMSSKKGLRYVGSYSKFLEGTYHI